MNQLEKAFVLHVVKYRESSFFVDFLTENHGKIRILVRNKHNKHSSRQAILQPFTPLLINWTQSKEVYYLNKIEPIGIGIPFYEKKIFLSLYVNEIVNKLVKPQSPCQEIFHLYLGTLLNLAKRTDTERILRYFEFELFDLLGYSFNFLNCLHQKNGNKNLYFFYDESKGMQRTNSFSPLVFSLEEIAILHKQDFNCKLNLRVAKKFVRIFLKNELKSPIVSRSYFIMKGS
ncbi:DNA repair protein RecO [Paraphotobacterium marinum]|uniref:DNA repair protein RecO n=1 Tax=Paraphotobacterium marinum TaxID=1755811 RepID=A0A220VBU1_9GAMM|nr:DNA repair protein RecO [Paraphotobacterium marinum]ASK77864.1 DNA repair protein RecO [Paraphotobacterium marinum]